MIFMIDLKEKPELCDELQHSFQERITTKFLEDVGIMLYIIGHNSTDKEVKNDMS